MEFFQNLSKYLDDTDMNLTIRGGKNSIVVLVVPKSTSQEKSTLPPLSMEGTPEELDANFFEAITGPIEKAKFILKNTEVFLKAAKDKEDEAKKKAEKKTSAVGSKTTPKPKASEDEKEEETPEPVKVPSNQPSLF